MVHFCEEMVDCHYQRNIIIGALYLPYGNHHVLSPASLAPNTTVNGCVLGGTLHLCNKKAQAVCNNTNVKKMRWQGMVGGYGL